MNAGPRKGSTARMPRRSPSSDRSPAFRTRSSPGRACSAPKTMDWAMSNLASAANLAGIRPARGRRSPSHEDGPRQSERDALATALEADVDRALELAARHHGDARAGHQATALELTQLDRIVVGDSLDRDLLARAAFAQRAVADGRQLAGERRDGMAGGAELRPAQQPEEALFHPLRNHG